MIVMLMPLLFLAIPWLVFLILGRNLFDDAKDAPYVLAAWTVITFAYLLAVALVAGVGR